MSKQPGEVHFSPGCFSWVYECYSVILALSAHVKSHANAIVVFA